MADTPRTAASILSRFPDNSSGTITPQRLRDFVVSITTPVAGGGFDASASAQANYVIYKSGSTYYAANKSTGATDFSGANAGNIIKQAAAALTSGGLISLADATTYNCTSQISLGAGVTLRGSKSPNEGSTNPPLVKSTSNIAAGALISLDGTGASVVNLNVDAGTTATHAVLMNNDATAVHGGFLQGGTTYTLANTLATARQRVSHVRCDGNGHPSVAVVEFNSTDHIVHDLVATGSGTVTSMNINGNTGQFSNMHITGNTTSADCLVVAGDQNNLGQLTLDTCGSNATAPLLITGSRNMFSSVGSMNIGSGLSLPAVAFKGSSVFGNIISGLSYTAAVQNQNATGLVEFLTGAGATPANLSNYLGTQIYFGAKQVDFISGAIANRAPTTSEAVWLRGYISTGSAAGAYDYHPTSGVTP